MPLIGSIDPLPKDKPSNLSPLVLAAGLGLLVFSTALADIAGLKIPAQCAAEETPKVRVEFSVPDQTTIYRIASGDCTIEWIARGSEKGVVKHWSQCTAPLAQQLPLLTKICTEFFSNDMNAQTFRTLFWGGLVPERKPASLELSYRLALAAYQSPGWDVKKGKPKKEDINRFVRDLANREMIYPELKDLFDGFNRSVKLSAVEKVGVLEAGQLPFFSQLQPHGIKAGDKLPFDCMAWFSVSKK
jgi:hypothetical protein